MSRMDAFKAYIKDNPMELDVAMAEVYAGLTDGTRGFVMGDGGSHKGWHALQMLRLPGAAEVVAIEADPTMFRTLQDNMSRWHPSLKTDAALRLVGKALQDDPAITTIPWMSSHSHVGRSSIRAENAEAPTIWSDHEGIAYRDETRVPATTLDLVFAGERRALPFIKLDLEGADILALRGAEATLTDKRPVVAFENAANAPKVHGYTLDDVQDYFNRVGYVGLDYTGAPLDPATWFDFYEAWTVPRERVEEVQALIATALEKRL